MSMTTQLLFATGLLAICSGAHIVLLVVTIGLLGRIADSQIKRKDAVSWSLLISVAFAAVVISHTIHVWLWATAILWTEALKDFDTALYFALVTYTTLGYGDITVGAEYRMFVAMAAVTGLLNFGLSTAFLVGIFSRMVQRRETKS